MDDSFYGIFSQSILLQLVLVELQRNFFDVLSGNLHGSYAFDIFQGWTDIILSDAGQTFKIARAVVGQAE
ncbi:hypothetical protein D3C81_1496230 [compost metagenome]